MGVGVCVCAGVLTSTSPQTLSPYPSPYHLLLMQDGLPDTVSLCNLSKKYAAQFEVKVEDVYNTILDIWRIRREAEAGKTISIFSQDHQVCDVSSVGGWMWVWVWVGGCGCGCGWVGGWGVGCVRWGV